MLVWFPGLIGDAGVLAAETGLLKNGGLQ